MKKIPQIVAIIALGTPLLALASTVPGGINLGVITPYSDKIIVFINAILVPVLMAIAFIVFLWGVYKYFILGAADESSKGEGRKFAMWGIIGFVVIVSVWGLVALVREAAGLNTGINNPTPPTFNTSSGGRDEGYINDAINGFR